MAGKAPAPRSPKRTGSARGRYAINVSRLPLAAAQFILGAAVPTAFLRWWMSIPLVVIWFGGQWFLTRKVRRTQRLLGAALGDPSSSGSARRAIQLIDRMLELNADERELTRVIDTVTSLRRHPSTGLLAPISSLIEHDVGAHRQAARDYCARALLECGRSRTTIVHEVAATVRGLEADSSTVLVLYGYSTTVCEGLVRAHPDGSHAVWVVEDLQYGDRELSEHNDTVAHLEQAGVHVTVLPFESFVAALGARPQETVHAADGSVVAVPRAATFVGLLGCDAVDDRGTVLLPAQVAGATSASAKFVELFDVQRHPNRQLYVAAEAFKFVPDADRVDRATSSPVKVPWWISALHGLGLASPFRGKEVRLCAVRQHVTGIVSDDGLCQGPAIREQRMRWEQRVGVSPPALAQDNDKARPFSSASAIDAVIFDFNGVLIDDELLHYEAFRAVVAHSTGAALSLGQYRRDCQWKTDEEGLRSLQASGLVSDVAGLAARKSEAYASALAAERDMTRWLTDGAAAFLRQCQGSGKAIGLISSSAEDEVVSFLDVVGLLHYFAPEHRRLGVTSTSREFELRTLARALGARPARTVVIDDSPGNIEAARNLRFVTVWLSTLQDDPEAAHSADVEDFLDLLDRTPAWDAPESAFVVRRRS